MKLDVRLLSVGLMVVVLGCASTPPGGAGGGGSEGGGSAGGGSAGGGSAGGGAAGGGTSGGGTSGGGTSSSGGGTTALQGCEPLSVDAGVSVGGYRSDVYRWSDGDCRPRTTALVRNDAADPGGSRGGFARQMTYEASGTTRVAVGPPGGEWRGFGYVVNHYGSTADTSHDRTGTYRTVLAGRHHAIHEFKVRMQPGGPVDATIHWRFATGQSHPVYAVTFDATAAGANTVNADTRTPYGNLTFDGVANDSTPVTGLAWGDAYRFTTTGTGAVTLQSAWDYSAANTVPFASMWTGNDAEMGLVQTLTQAQFPAGGDYGGNALKNCQGKTSAAPGTCPKAGGTVMIQDWLWPYQLNQYELPFVNSSKRLAWGSSYGAVGQSMFSQFGQSRSGFPRFSYSVWVVLGRHTPSAVDAQRAFLEAVQTTILTATRGQVAAQVPAGVGRSDQRPTTPAGWDPVYGTFVAQAASGLTLRLDPGGKTLVRPVLRVLEAQGKTTVAIDGVAQVPDRDVFLTVDGATTWLTLNREIAAPITLTLD